ncbi:hypothetical protein U3516DRAFT_766464 [Neocallimastix sp. 'constans']
MEKNQEIEISKTNRGKEQIILNRKFISMDLICPGYNSVKSQLPPDITTFDEIPNKSKNYKTKRNENFMIFKNHDLIVIIEV